MSWTQPLCERCWVKENSTWELIEGVGEVLRGVRQPARVDTGNIEQCCMCGDITISGIFVRKDPAKIPFPRVEDDHLE